MQWEWIKGHTLHRENELADQLSQQAIKEFLKSLDIAIPERHQIMEFAGS